MYGVVAAPNYMEAERGDGKSLDLKRILDGYKYGDYLSRYDGRRNVAAVRLAIYIRTPGPAWPAVARERDIWRGTDQSRMLDQGLSHAGFALGGG